MLKTVMVSSTACLVGDAGGAHEARRHEGEEHERDGEDEPRCSDDVPRAAGRRTQVV